MSSSRPLILVIGCGSIGERHVRTFLATGRAGVIACDNRPAILRQMSERYGVEAVARALEDAFTYQAFSCEYIANLLHQRQHPPEEPGALHLTRQQDLLELELPAPDLSIYDAKHAATQTPNA